MQQEKELVFNLKGNELTRNKYNLHLVIEGLLLSQKILEQAYLITANRDKMSKTDRGNFKIYISDIREGSFESNIIIFMKNVSAALLPGYSGLNPKDIWALVSMAIKYLLTIFKANEKGERIEVNITDSPGAEVHVNSNNGTTYVRTSQDVRECANKIEPIVKKTMNIIDEERGVHTFNLIDPEEQKNNIVLGLKEKKLFANDLVLEDEVIEFEGKITSANFNNFTGKVKIINYKSSGLEEEEYKFSFLEKINEEFFRLSCSKILVIKALKQVSFNTLTLQKEVKSLKFVSMV